MRFKLILSIVFAFVSYEMTYATDSATRIAQALELLQKNDKPKALKLLEKAFESTSDSDELKQISILILEASPQNYPKREGYLQYLIKFNADHEEAWRWYKEMGDRAFDRSKMDEAEDWYLRAKPTAKDPSIIQYKLAWVYWNLNRKVEAFQNFLEIYSNAAPNLQSQILKDLAKLWWEIGALPPSVFDQAMSLPEDARNDLLDRFIHSTPAHLEASLIVESQLLQIKTEEKSKEYFYKGLKTGFQFKAAPCFLFNSILSPGDEFSKENFLACVKAKDRPPADKLLTYFSHLPTDSDERIPWAQAELYIENDRLSDAALILFQFPTFSEASKDYLKFTAQVLMRLDEKDFKKLYEMAEPSRFEILVEKTAHNLLLDRLEAIDTERWLQFEETKLQGKTPKKEFLIKKGVWLAQKQPDDSSALEQIFTALIKPPVKGDEKRMQEDYNRLIKRANTKLPTSFTEQFKKKYDEWIKDIDRSLEGLKKSSTDLQIIARPIFQKSIEKNIDQLIAQIDTLQLDSKIEDVQNSFEQKKEALKNELRSKYILAIKSQEESPQEETKP
jgi:hypothetical protein